MTARQRIASFLSATVFVSGMAFAATTAPPATTPPPTTTPPAPTAPVTPTPPVTPALLWIYGDPTPQWLTLSYHASETGCTAVLATIHPTPTQDAGCFPVGVDPARLHDQYGVDPALPVAKP
jgi:hypothetical protein